MHPCNPPRASMHSIGQHVHGRAAQPAAFASFIHTVQLGIAAGHSTAGHSQHGLVQRLPCLRSGPLRSRCMHACHKRGAGRAGQMLRGRFWQLSRFVSSLLRAATPRHIAYFCITVILRALDDGGRLNVTHAAWMRVGDALVCDRAARCPLVNQYTCTHSVQVVYAW